MTDQTELLAALDVAYEACRETYGDADEAGARLSILQALRDQIANGQMRLCPGIPDPNCNYSAGCGQVCNKCGKVHRHHLLTLPALTGADR